MTDNFVLLHSPLVGPTSLQPTAVALTRLGQACQVPDVTIGQSLPAWRNWPDQLLKHIVPQPDMVVVGHSMAGLLAASVAAALGAHSIVLLDALIPPTTGKTPPVEPGFHHFIRRLPVQDGLLPAWHQWWGIDLLADLHEAERSRLVQGIPRLAPDWFDDAFDMPDWSHCRKYYLQLSASYAEAAQQAQAAGWIEDQLHGTHLHPTLAAEATATALLNLLGRKH